MPLPSITWQDVQQMPDDGNRYEATERFTEALPVRLGTEEVGLIDLESVFAPDL